MIDLSKVFKNAVINLYAKGVYTVDYAIIEASKLADKNKINATDYEELITYLAEEQAKSMQKVEEKTEENVETTEKNMEVAETTEETSTEESVVE
jgi:hypothetical protein